MPHYLRSIAAAIIAASALVLTGCAAPTASQSSTGDLTLTIAKGISVPAGVMGDFERETGTRVSISSKHPSASELADRVVAGTVGTDLAIGIPGANDVQLGTYAKLLPFTSTNSGLGAINYAYTLNKSMTAFGYSYVCAVIDTQWMQANGLKLPAGFAQLGTAPYAKNTLMPNPSTSAEGLTYMLTANSQHSDFRTENWADYWHQLRAAGLQTTTSAAAGGTVAELLSGSAHIGVAAPLQLPERYQPVGTTCTRLPSYAGIVRGSTHVNTAKKFIDFLLTADAQTKVSTASNLVPVSSDANLNRRQKALLTLWSKNGQGNTDVTTYDERVPRQVTVWEKIFS